MNISYYRSLPTRRNALLGLGIKGISALALSSCSSAREAGASASPTGDLSVTPSPTGSLGPTDSFSPTGGMAPSQSPTPSGSASPSASSSATSTSSPSASASSSASAAVVPSVNPVPAPRPWDGPQTGLAGEGRYIAWTVDDGANPEVVRAYAEFSRRTGTRLTFFMNGQYPAFEQHRELLLPLVKSGQLQIANHTFSHPALTALSDEQIVWELTRNDEEIQRLFGVSSKPYFRPPYGYYDARVLAAAASCGFTRPVLWYGSLADSSDIPSAEVMRFAKEYVGPQRILIGHLNYPGVISVLDDIRALMLEQGLSTVTIRDYYG